ncbi:hypothetical protein H8E50_03040, partial [bacterium]|nr:hypothetical protein [bacterium]
YNSLLGSSEDVHSEALSLIEDNAGEKELAAYFAIRKVKHPAECVKNLMNLRQHIRTFRTVQERRIMREVIPQMLEGALSSEVPDRSIAGLEKLFSAYHIKSLHLTAFQEQKDLMLGILKIFSLSPYLTHIFLSNQLYLDTLIEEWSILKTLTDIKARVERAINRAKNIGQFLAEFRRMEEIRLGMLYLQGILQTNDLYRGISHLADAIIGAITERLVSKDLAIIALGKLGGREMNFGSDLDIIFVSASEEAMSAAERILTTLTSYTESGILYEVDTRLRPDGARGILVNDIEGFRNYYLNSAQNWEIQALLRARPVAGDHKLTLSFIEMAKTVVQERGDSVKQEDISSMRKRIVEELSMESKGIDIKLGPGGIEEIEFFIQYLQLQHARAHPDILVQNMHSAFHRLEKSRLLDKEDAETLRYAYKYFRKIETILRLNALSFIADDSDIPDILAKVMGMKDRAAIMEKLLQLRKNVLAITNR